MNKMIMLKKIQPKKAVSEMVSYVLLVIIAVSLSIIVLAYLISIVPKGEKPECLNDVNLALQKYACTYSQGKINITIENKGLFTVDAMYVRLGKEGRRIREITLANPEFLTWRNPLTNILEKGLPPGEIFNKTYNSTLPSQNLILEIQPATFNEKDQLAVCEKAVITQPIYCA